MSLKTEIDKTNDLKYKTKKAKDNINTKLVELGGQNANNLADIPNKMQGMIGQYKKIAILSNLNKTVFKGYLSEGGRVFKTDIQAELSFDPWGFIIVYEIWDVYVSFNEKKLSIL